MQIQLNQIRAARALLGWSQKDLAERSGLSDISIMNYENNKRTPHQKTVERILQSFELAGIVFTENGVELRNNPITVISGNDWWLRILEDCYQTLVNHKKPEVLLICADDRVSPPEVNERMRKMKNAGIKMRMIIEEDNTYIMGPLNEYRYMPKERFINYVSMIYGDKVVVCTDNNTKAVVFNDPHLSRTWNNLFDTMWDVLPQPTISTAKERF